MARTEKIKIGSGLPPGDLSSAITRLLPRKPYPIQVQVVCVGTDRSTGDALGPLVGTALRESQFPFPVYGTLDEPVHAQNLPRCLAALDPSLYTIAVDACLGRDVGAVHVGLGPARPGAGVAKSGLPEVGDMHIYGVVNSNIFSDYMQFMVLQNTRLSLVMRLAKYIASELACAVSVPVT